MFRMKLREAQRPVRVRDGIGGPVKVVTADEWVEFRGFKVIPEFIAHDESLEVEEVASSPTASETSAPALNESPSAKPASPQPTRRRRRNTQKKASEG